MDWGDVKDALRWDGSLRDIYVLKTSIDDWERMFAAFRSWPHAVRYLLDGNPKDLPLTAKAAFDVPVLTSLLVVDVNGVKFISHFFTRDEIEFDIDPRDLTASNFGAIEDFMRRLGGAVERNVLLTPENEQDCPILEYLAHTDSFVRRAES